MGEEALEPARASADEPARVPARSFIHDLTPSAIMKTNTTGPTLVLLTLALTGSAISQACSSGGGNTTSSSGGSGGSTTSPVSGSGGDTTSSSVSSGTGGASATSTTSSGAGGTSSSTGQGGVTSTSSGTGGQGPGDGGTGDGGSTSLCGAHVCREDQACVAGHCTTACVGTQVPGDYATVQGAISALQGVGGTICLGPQTFAEGIIIANTQPLTIVGTSDLSAISGYVNIKGRSSVTLRNFTVTTTTTVVGAVTVLDNTGNLDVVLRGMKMGSPDAFGSGFLLEDTNAAVTILLDGCDLTGPTDAYAMLLTGNHGGLIGDSLSMVVENCYLHDAMAGMHSDAILMSLSLVNNTIVNNGTGIEAHVGDEELSLSTYNSIITGSDVGISLSGTGGSMVSGNNLLFGNTTNYMGVAVEGPGYVKESPLFDANEPPGLGVGSPARGAADPAQAPATDYYGHARPAASPDMGAVQM